MSYRIAMVGACPYPVPQGSQALIRDTASALRDAGHVVHLVTYGYGAGDDETGLPVHRSPRIPGLRRTAAGPSLGKPLLDLAMVWTLRRFTRRRDMDLVHAHNYEGLLVALFARKRPIVYHAHNALADELPYYFRRAAWAERFGAWLDTALPRRADHVIVPHKRLKRYLCGRGCEAERVSVIPPPVNPLLLATPDWAAAAPSAGEPPPVLYTGNLDAYQNLPLLLRAMEIVRADHPAARLLIATADDRAVPGAERVPVHGLRDLHEILARDVVVACPRVSWSGYPVKMLNAMAAGKPIVACRSAAHGLIHGREALIAPDNDVEAFAEALIRLISDPALREQLGRRARETAAQRCNPVAVSDQIIQVYNCALNSGRPDQE